MPLPRTRPPRPLDLTEAHIARVARPVADPGPSQRFARLTDQDFETLAAQMLALNTGNPFWVFAYGSLIWKPAFDHVEARASIAHGWRRSFCINLIDWRGTPEVPGLMLALDRGGACAGVAYRMPDDDPHRRMVRLLKREISTEVDIPALRWLTVRAGGERFRAFTFYCTPESDPDLVRLPHATQAARIARAVGHGGSCAEYLRNTVAHLEALGIRDSYLWRMQAMVAAEIDALP